MAIKAVFVGINKHQDPTIPELSGARRDAMALWALFTDTIKECRGVCFLDEQATHAEVGAAILGAPEQRHRQRDRRDRGQPVGGGLHERIPSGVQQRREEMNVRTHEVTCRVRTWARRWAATPAQYHLRAPRA